MTASPVPPPSDNWAGGAEVAELAYSSIDPRRPWLVSAIGVTSIVVASLSLLGAIYSGLMLIPMLAFAGVASTGGGTGLATATTPPNSITAAEADVIVAALDSQVAISPADQTLLAGALVACEFPIAPPADGTWTSTHVTGQISGYSVSTFSGSSSTDFNLNNGGTISLNTGSVMFNYSDANGNYVFTTYGPNGANTNSTALGAGIEPFSKLNIALQIASFVLSLGLAALLLIAGIQTVRGMPSGRKLHLWWAWPKLLAAAVAAGTWYLWFEGMFGGFGGVGGPPTSMPLIMAGISFAIAIIWPVTVLILLRVRSVRGYYADA